MRHSPLLAIFLIVAVDVLGLTIMIPLLPFYAEKLGATPFQVGWLIGAYAACQLISGPLLGRLSDSTGRKPLLLVSQAGTFIGFIITAFAPNLIILFLARMIDGATAGNLSLAQAYISDITKPEDRAKSFGVIGIAFGIGFLIGPAISGILAKLPDIPVSGFHGSRIIGLEHHRHLSAVAESRAGKKRRRPSAVLDRLGRICKIFSRSAIVNSPVAIPVFHFRIFRCLPRRLSLSSQSADRPGTARPSGRSRQGFCLRLGRISWES